VINRLNKQHKVCPNQKFALVGYSQGAGIMHGALGPPSAPYPGGPKERPVLNQEVIPKILALVMFGDSGFSSTSELAIFGPQFPPLLFERLKQNCANGDMVSFTTNTTLMLTL
jgi:cutinase